MNISSLGKTATEASLNLSARLDRAVEQMEQYASRIQDSVDRALALPRPVGGTACHTSETPRATAPLAKSVDAAEAHVQRLMQIANDLEKVA